MAMEQAGLSDPERSSMFCEIAHSYQKCMKATGQACRGDMLYHASERAVKQLVLINCPHKGGSGTSKGSRNEPRGGHSTTTANVPRPSCRYYGMNKFRHCGFFGDPHLKTFDGKYQTCRVHGSWVLIDNPYMFVQVTNKPVLAESFATAPTKVSVFCFSFFAFCVIFDENETRWKAV